MNGDHTSDSRHQQTALNFSEELSREILASLRLRASIMAAAFAFGSIILATGTVYFLLFLREPFPPWRALPYVIGMVGYELYIRSFLFRCIRSHVS